MEFRAHQFLQAKDFSQSKSDYSLFTRTHQGLFTFVLLYTDDLSITGDDVHGIARLEHDLHNAFTIKDLSLARYFFGIEISRSPQGTLLNQMKYVLDILTV